MSKPKPPLEKEVLRACLDYLQKVRRWECWRNNSGAWKAKDRFIRFGKKGSADILGILPPDGRFLAVETKREGGILSLDQAAFLDRVRASGGLAMVVRSLDDLIRGLELEGL